MHADPAHPPRLTQLDAIRTFAAVGVALFHVGAGRDGMQLFSHGYVLVDLFFLLSGFVLSLAFEERFAAGLGAGAFMQIRLRRIWPLVALASVFGALSFLPFAPIGQVAYLLLLALLMVPNLNLRLELYPLSGVQWSLLWELIVNAAHVLLLRRMTTVWLAALVASSGVAFALCIAHFNGASVGSDTRSGLAAMPRVLWSYGLGMLMARWWAVRVLAPGRLSGLEGRLDWRLAIVAPLAATALVGLLPIPFALIDSLAVFVLMPTLFWLALHAPAPRQYHRVLSRFGQISFPFYAIHVPFLTLADFLYPSLTADLLALTAAFAVSCLMAWRWRPIRGTSRLPVLRMPAKPKPADRTAA